MQCRTGEEEEEGEKRRRKRVGERTPCTGVSITERASRVRRVDWIDREDGLVALNARVHTI